MKYNKAVNDMRITIKVGTSTLTHTTGRLNIRQMEALCKVLSDVKNAGHEVTLVSSGAIGMGVGRLNLPCRPADMPTKQAAAAVGQCELMYVYDKLFSEHNHTVAQILLNADDVNDPHRRTNISNTLERLLALGALPIINENDAVGTDEIGVTTTIGENDTLSAIVARLIHADLLVILSDIDGLYTADPRKDPDARLIPEVREITPELRPLPRLRQKNLSLRRGQDRRRRAPPRSAAAGANAHRPRARKARGRGQDRGDDQQRAGGRGRCDDSEERIISKKKCLAALLFYEKTDVAPSGIRLENEATGKAFNCMIVPSALSTGSVIRIVTPTGISSASTYTMP